MTRSALAALPLAALLGCGSSLSGPSKSAALGDPVELRFDGVASDSRCPIDVVCIQAGDAVLRVHARRLPKAEASLVLHTQLSGSSAAFQGFVVALVELKPVPKASESIPPGRYVATLKVTRP